MKIEITRIVTAQLTQIVTVSEKEAEMIAERSAQDVQNFADGLKHNTDADDVTATFQLFMREVEK